MRKIYQTAEAVLVYLGDQDEDTVIALRYIYPLIKNWTLMDSSADARMFWHLNSTDRTRYGFPSILALKAFFRCN